MAETVRLTVNTGPHKGTRFCFRGPANCLVGRAPDCFVRFVGADRDLCISRHHCQLYVDPPMLRVQDLGSRNGTYINGHPVEAMEGAQDAKILFEGGSPIGNARNGDIITIGGTSFVVDVVDCPPSREEDEPFWKEGDVAKQGCALACSH